MTGAPSRRWTFGAASVDTVIDLDPLVFALNDLFPEASLGALAPDRALLEGTHVDFAQAAFLLAVQSFVIRIGGRTILIDSCVGEHKARGRPEWNQQRDTGFLDRLGVAPEAVDVVLCTHLHSDHVGWNTRLAAGHWVPTFPNARYIMSRRELAHWEETARTKPETAAVAAYRDSVLPVIEAGQMTLIDQDHELAPGLAILPLPGHTPGQIGVTLSDGAGGRAVFCGDAIHSPAQILHPDWTTPYCLDPATARATRAALIAEAADTGAILIPGHLRGTSGMRVSANARGPRPVFV